MALLNFHLFLVTHGIRHSFVGGKFSKKGGDPDQDQIYVISSGDEDFSKGMIKWIREYHQSRQGLNIL
ncbi:hypothetical protein Ahy_B07g087563 [Arachis hypogaea]|uniref:Uncharacterized protein n=1 Tax=Arachis hypogaea TaxID=3818 RepID=A0A444YCG9_ARAHY|nr:hypothetical protein Ahy_B07g087563 [Arachis hypogaea]